MLFMNDFRPPPLIKCYLKRDNDERDAKLQNASNVANRINLTDLYSNQYCGSNCTGNQTKLLLC